MKDVKHHILFFVLLVLIYMYMNVSTLSFFSWAESFLLCLWLFFNDFVVCYFSHIQDSCIYYWWEFVDQNLIILIKIKWECFLLCINIVCQVLPIFITLDDIHVDKKKTKDAVVTGTVMKRNYLIKDGPDCKLLWICWSNVTQTTIKATCRVEVILTQLLRLVISL